jgi:hypothetical protein
VKFCVRVPLVRLLRFATDGVNEQPLKLGVSE